MSEEKKPTTEIVSFNKEAFSLETFDTNDLVVDELERRLEMALATPLVEGCGQNNCGDHGDCWCDTNNCGSNCTNPL